MMNSGLKKVRTENEMYFADITPAAAAKLLLNNVTPRPINQNYAKHLAKAMENGEFQLVTDCIGINKEGQLTNGQHRLQAAVIANLTMRLPVMEGVEVSMFQDRGRKRSIVCNAKAVEPGNDLITTRNVSVVTLLAKIAGVDLLETECVQVINAHADLFRALEASYRTNYINRRIPFYAAALLAAMDGASLDKISEYSELLTTGVLKNKDQGVEDNKKTFQVIKMRDGILRRRGCFAKLESQSYMCRREILFRVYDSMRSYCVRRIDKKKVASRVTEISRQFFLPIKQKEAAA